MPDITYDVGHVSFVMKGAWNLATSYEKLDAVSNNGNLYIAKQNVPGGTAITNTTYWQLAAEKGDKGDTGGVDSVNGQQGDVWFPDSRQLISDSYTTDTEPFLMKGNDSDSDRFELAKKLGNTVGVNQLYNVTLTRERNGVRSVAVDGAITLTGTSTATGNSVEFAWTDFKITSGHKILILSDLTLPAGDMIIDQYNGSPYTSIIGRILTITSGYLIPQLRIANTGVTYSTSGRLYVIDLTLWFGSNDRIPSDLLAHPENWGRYYAGSLDYEPGRLESADGTVLTSIGTDGITVFAEVDTGSEVLRSGLTFSDSKLPNGTITRIAAVVTYDGSADETWSYLPAYHCMISGSVADIATGYTPESLRNNYGVTVQRASLNGTALQFGNSLDPIENYASSEAAWRTLLSQHPIEIIYPLATPTTEQGTAFDPLVVTVKNGVLSWTNTKGIPVGHESHYFENLRKRVEDRLPDPPSADGTYRLTCTISGGVKTYSWEA